MKQIRVLSQAVADQIAAGEVAERPSAVVKELVENAMDAGADRITVEIQKGGVDCIRVADNGSGIPEDQVETAFLRHATSKLVEIDDLYRISTMGFRGEALASICAVAQVEMITKTADAEEGICLELNHGVPSRRDKLACSNGTTVLVKNLFANVPARMKFLKKDSTEAGYVYDLLSRIALSRPDIAFTYICDGKEMFATSGDGKLESVILKIYGLDHAKGVLPVDYTEDNIQICGVIGKPELARGNRTRQTLFVNGRYVKNHVIAKVAEEAFRNSIMVGRFPFFVLQLNLPKELVDVNVHPAKTEVKFANEKQIYDVAYHAIRNALYTATEPKKDETTKIPQRNTSKTNSGNHGGYGSAFKQDRVDPVAVRSYLENTIPKAEEKNEEGLPKTTYVFRDVEETKPVTAEEVLDALLEQEEQKSTTAEQMTFPQVKEETTNETHIRVIGQVFDTYILCQQGETMLLIDQHAAHERLRFESLREAYLKKEHFSQMLLTPIVLSLEYQEKQTVMEHLDYFSKFGFVIEDFGGNGILLQGAPISGDEGVLRDLVLELAEALQMQMKHPIADFEEYALDMISCKYAIKANHKLTLTEMQDLVQRACALEDGGVKTCPHGRPLRVEFSKIEIEKLFKRRV